MRDRIASARKDILTSVDRTRGDVQKIGVISAAGAAAAKEAMDTSKKVLDRVK